MMANLILKNTIKVERAKKDLTQEGLAQLVDVTRKTINSIERGNYVPSTLLALKIVRAFGARFEDVFFLIEKQSTDSPGPRRDS